MVFATIYLLACLAIYRPLRRLAGPFRTSAADPAAGRV